MATGINVDKVNGLKLDLLGYIESMNKLINRLNTCKIGIQSNMDGSCKSEIIDKLDNIIDQLPMVNANINSYISTINRIVKEYEIADVELGTTIARNISKLEN